MILKIGTNRLIGDENAKSFDYSTETYQLILDLAKWGVDRLISNLEKIYDYVADVADIILCMN